MNYLQKIESFYRFNTSILHDLNNYLQTAYLPLFTITKEACAQHRELRDNMMKSINNISSFSQTMSQLLNDGNFKSLKFKPLNHDEVEEQLKMMLGPKIGDKNLTFKFELKDSIFVVQTNPDLLIFSILGNILSNCIKFSAENSTIKVLFENEKGNSRISIIDEAGCIPEEIIKSILRGKERVKSTQGSMSEEGHGFGLGIIKYYCTVLGVEFNLENHGQGTHFSLTFPS